MLAVSPNPVSGSAEISFAVSHAGPVTMTAFDVGGRRIVSSALRSFTPGRHRVQWDPRDASGLRIPSGMYFLQIGSAGGKPCSARILLLR